MRKVWIRASAITGLGRDVECSHGLSFFALAEFPGSIHTPKFACKGASERAILRQDDPGARAKL